ncbi:MAG TPA: hypothetical protein VIL85_02610 [Thermomicrobiales bacterium]|jgi:hypothetical protein
MDVVRANATPHNGATGAIALAGRPLIQDINPEGQHVTAREMIDVGMPDDVGDGPAPDPSTPLTLPRRANQLAKSGAVSDTSLQVQSLALDAISHIRAILQTNATLVQQSAALEQQLQTLLAERIALIERIAVLEEQLAPSSSRYATRPTACHAVPFRPLANLPAILHNKRLEAIASPQTPDPVTTLPMAGGRFPHPVVSDEETLLGSTGRPAAPDNADTIDADPPSRRRDGEMHAAPNGSPLRDYALIAQPFARFTDLGGFQSAVQALPGIHNVRVRRFAQGVLEMRVDYDGAIPLADLLRRLAYPVEEVTHEDPTHLRIRLAPLRERGFPALS